MIGTITHILAKAGYKSMNGPLADERRRLAGAVPPAAYVSYDPRLLAGAGWYGYRISIKGGGRSMLEMARYMLEQQYTIRDSYEYYTDGIYTFGVLLRQRVPHYGIGGGGATQEPDALNFYMPDGGTITLTRNGTPTVVELEYSIDGGATWQVWEEVGNVRSLTLAAGGKMYVRNTSETSTGFCAWTDRYYTFGMDSGTIIGGDVRSLLCRTAKNGVLSNFCFFNLFSGASNIIDAAKLLLLSSDIPRSAYRSMFYRCSGMVNGPTTLTATSGEVQCCFEMFRLCSSLVASPCLTLYIIPGSGYHYMFVDCSALVDIRTEMTDISVSNAIDGWLIRASAIGDFYCPAELTIPTGASGIPQGWTRHDI